MALRHCGMYSAGGDRMLCKYIGYLTCLLLMGGSVQGLTRALQRLGPLDSKSPTCRPGTTGTGRGSTTTAYSVTMAPAVQRFVDTIFELPSSVMGTTLVS